MSPARSASWIVPSHRLHLKQSATSDNSPLHRLWIHFIHQVIIYRLLLKYILSLDNSFGWVWHQCNHSIHTSIVSGHLATRGNNKILHTPPPHIRSSEEILCRTLAQLKTNNSPFLKNILTQSQRQITSITPCPLYNAHTQDTHHLFNCSHIYTMLSPLDLWTYPPEWLHYWPDGRRSWLVDHKQEDLTPPTSNGHRSW